MYCNHDQKATCVYDYLWHAIENMDVATHEQERKL